MARGWALRPARALPHLPGESVQFLSRSRGEPAPQVALPRHEQHDGYVRTAACSRGHRDRGHDERDGGLRHGRDRSAIRSNAFNAWEGYSVASTARRAGSSTDRGVGLRQGTETVQGGIAPDGVRTRVIPLRGSAREVTPGTRPGTMAAATADAGGYFPAGERGGQVFARGGRTRRRLPILVGIRPAAWKGREGARGRPRARPAAARLCADADAHRPVPMPGGMLRPWRFKEPNPFYRR